MAWATDWHKVTSSDEFVMSVDFDKVFVADIDVLDDKSKTYLNMLAKFEYFPDSMAVKKNTSFTLGQYFISCDGYAFLNSSVSYNSSGHVIKTWKGSKVLLTSADFDYAFPNTVLDSAIQATCTYYKTGERPMYRSRFLTEVEINQVLPKIPECKKRYPPNSNGEYSDNYFNCIGN